MDAAGGHSWHRLRYPLQTLSNGSPQPSTAVSPSEQADDTASHWLPDSTQCYDGSASWHRAVTGDQLERCPLMSQLGNDTKRFSRPVDDTDDNDSSQAPALWSRDMYPADVPTDTSSENHPLTPEEEHEQPLVEGPELSQKVTTKRVLRRTPRSRQITSPFSPEAVEKDLYSVQLMEKAQSVAPSTATPWKRQDYPLQPATGSLMAHHPNPVPSEQQSGEAQEIYPDQPETREEASTASVWRDKPVNTLQSTNNSSTALSPSSSLPSENELAHVDEPTTTQVRESSPAANVNKSWNRETYPLQAPVSNANLQRLPTPPLSPDREQQQASEIHPDRPIENDESHTKSKAFRRQVYPSQAPASNANLQRSPTPPLPGIESHRVSKVLAEEPSDNKQALTKSKMSRRQVYPLQAPASVANLRCLPTPPSLGREPRDSSKLHAEYPQESNQAGTVVKTFRRRVYPIQTPASITNLRGSPTPPSSPKLETRHAKEAPEEDPKEKNQGGTRSKMHRKVYPLQSPASMADLLPPSLPLSSPSVMQETRRDDKPPAIQLQEKQLAGKVISHWRRQTYPLQSPENVSQSQRSPSPQPLEQKDTAPRSIHLPRNVRAATDSERHDPQCRTIVVCLDGTGDKFDNDNSNIVHLISALKKDDPHQVSYYQTGIGTYSANGLSAGASAAMDMAVGSGLGLHVRDAYNFLMHTYKEGDKICIFGFSRGAYTARCLAGMIHKVGLLPPRNIQQIAFAYEFYKNDTPEGWKHSEDFKRTFCIDVCVHFLGCFDSVASVGFIPRQLPLSSTPTSKPRYFRHAMALDERRAKFKICRHQTKDWDEIEQSASPTDVITNSAQLNSLHDLPNYKSQDDAPPRYAPHMKYGETNHPNLTDEEYERLWGHEASFDTDVLEVWFLGAHADVGGGAVPNDERHKLAQIPLRWMIRQAFECNTGIIFKTEVLAEYGLDVHTLWPRYERLNAPAHGPPPSFLEKYEQNLPPRSVRRSKLVPVNNKEKGEGFYHLAGHTDDDWTPEQVEDFYDAMSPLNDQLVQAPSWWILELWPVRYKVPTALGEVSTRLGMNLGRYRGVDDYEPNVHWTVLQRVQHMDYKIEARTYANTTWRTVV